MTIKACSHLLLRSCAAIRVNMGRKEPPVQGQLVFTEETPVQRIPLFADGSSIDTDMVQTPSDRFHRWLSNFADLITEYRIGECVIRNTDIDELLDDPSDASLAALVRQPSEWNELLYELNLVRAAFSNMLLHDQLNAAELFEVQNVTKLIPNESNVMVPTVVEILRASFRFPFLAATFDIIWSHIRNKEIEPIAIYEIKKVTVHKIPGQWIREDRNGDSIFAVTNLLHNRQDQCDVCGGTAWVPFESCWFCRASPCYHHGRCCPARPVRSTSSSSSNQPTIPSSGQPDAAKYF